MMSRMWHKLTGKPDVMAAGPQTVTVANVPLLEAGVQYMLSTGPTTFTPDDLADAVCAAMEDKSIQKPRLWVGHTDPRFNDTYTYDATPSFGKADNLRLSENGMIVYGDYVGVPEWLAPYLPFAYPSRSIEGMWNVSSQTGKVWRFVLTSCKVLGVTMPGINQLEDLPLYYGKDVPPGVVIDAEAIAAAQKQPGGDPTRVRASAHLDDIRRAFFTEYAPGLGHQTWWIRAALTDPNELVVEDDESGQLYQISFASDQSGKVTFGDPKPVRLGLVPDEEKPELMKAAASHAAALLSVGREVLASWSTRAESSPTTTQGGSMDPKQIRERLGLTEDASDDQVREAIKALNVPGVTIGEAAPAVTEPVTPPVATTEPVAPAAPAAPAAEPAAPAEPAQIAASNLPPGTVLIDEATLESLKTGAKQAGELAAASALASREQLVMAAIGDGRIPPARKDHWVEYLKNDPGGAEVLASLTPGIVPVTERGHSHSPDNGGNSGDLTEEVVGSWTSHLFPETRSTAVAAPAAAAAAPTTRSRISRDGS